MAGAALGNVALERSISLLLYTTTHSWIGVVSVMLPVNGGNCAVVVEGWGEGSVVDCHSLCAQVSKVGSGSLNAC